MASNDLWSLLQNYEQGTLRPEEKKEFLERLVRSGLEEYFPELTHDLLVLEHPEWTRFTERRSEHATGWQVVANGSHTIRDNIGSREEARILARHLRTLTREKA